MSRVTHKIMIVDDEPLARKRIRDLLKSREDCAVVAEAANGKAAVQAIADCKPSIVLLDIEMPAVNGFDLIRLIGPDKMPIVIFVTAYDSYAIKAFEVAAVDYILKPFERERFYQALDRAIAAAGAKDLHLNQSRLKKTLERTSKRQSEVERILVKSTGTVTIVDVAQIRWIEAQGNYVLLHITNEEHLHRDTIKSLAARLDRSTFVRIHRSTIVNLSFVKQVETDTSDDKFVLLKDGTKLRLSRRYRNEFEKSFS